MVGFQKALKKDSAIPAQINDKKNDEKYCYGINQAYNSV